MLNDYLKRIAETSAQGDAREESYYGQLSSFIDAFADSIGRPKIQITTLPKKTEAGNPDFRIWDGQHHIVGYIEAKKPGENLDVIETSEQLKRYRSVFPNLILTDFYEFRLYRNGQLVDKVAIARPFIAKKLKTIPPIENEEKFHALLGKFFAFTLPKVFSAESLASELAKRTRFLRDEVIAVELDLTPGPSTPERGARSPLHGFYVAFKKYLIADLKKEGFADIYSQTITYGLFAARTRANGKFNRRLAFELIPPTIGILRDVFQFISLGKKLPVGMEVIIDDIAEVLQAAEVSNILHEYYRKGKGEDPIVHFYETFLNVYDPATREKRGVYYTPEPVVKYIVRAIHDILKTHFDLADGLASKAVTLLDPAAGTLTFPAEAIKLAVKEFTEKYGEGGLNRFFQNHILKNYYAFELMMAPYAIGHIKMAFLLEELGYKMQESDRFKLYLTNTLDMEDLAQTEIPGLESLSEESHQAGHIKRNEPILVILGNPPYSIEAGTLTKEARDLVEPYKFVDSVRIKEKGALQFEKNLQDDYVKFIAFAQRKIEQNSSGIVAYVNNHSFLETPTLRGMRNSLLKTFDEILVIDLHGSSKKNEKTLDGERDQNVFDIQQGVSINLFIKLPNGAHKKKIKRFDLFGDRLEKYSWLEKHTLAKTKFQTVVPQAPNFYFKKYDYELSRDFERHPSIEKIFPQNGVGVITAHDDFVVADSAKNLENRFVTFRNSPRDEDYLHQAFNVKRKKGWSILEAHDAIKKLTHEELRQAIVPFHYRPFDKRFIIYHEKLIWSRSFPTMQHMLRDNISICFIRQFSGEGGYSHVLASKEIVDNRTFFSSKGVIQQAPLYLFDQAERKSSLKGLMLFEPEENYGRAQGRPNLNHDLTAALKKAIGSDLNPDSIFAYIYGTLSSNTYRTKYVEFLKSDFPKIPFTADRKLFFKMADVGAGLVRLHTLFKTNGKARARFHGTGSDRIEKAVFDDEQQRIMINDSQFFAKVDSGVWNFHLGGFQTAKRFLDRRKGSILEDSSYYCQLLNVISETIELQKAADKLFPSIEQKTIH